MIVFIWKKNYFLARGATADEDCRIAKDFKGALKGFFWGLRLFFFFPLVST